MKLFARLDIIINRLNRLLYGDVPQELPKIRPSDDVNYMFEVIK